MKRPTKQARPTADLILDAATPLFYGHGLRAVSLDQVAAAAGLTKRTLHYHFPTKNELVVAYLRRWRESARAGLSENTAVPAGERIDAAFARLEREVAHPAFRGCPFVNAVAELNDRAHPATALAVAYKEDRRIWFEATLREVGVPCPGPVAEQVMVLWEGAIVRALVTRDACVVGQARRAAAALIEAGQR